MGAAQRGDLGSRVLHENATCWGSTIRASAPHLRQEAVDNALDAAEEAGILPDVLVNVEVAVANGQRRLRLRRLAFASRSPTTAQG